MLTQREFDVKLQYLMADIRNQIAALATEAGATYDSIRKPVQESLEATTYDGRSVEWRVRLRLYAQGDGYKEPVGDSDDDLPADKAGKTVLTGLPAVGSWISESASIYHGAPCAGMNSVVMAKKIQALRAQMSMRGDGTGVLRVYYQAPHNGSMINMLARCEVLRETDAPQRSGFHSSAVCPNGKRINTLS